MNSVELDIVYRYIRTQKKKMIKSTVSCILGLPTAQHTHLRGTLRKPLNRERRVSYIFSNILLRIKMLNKIFLVPAVRIISTRNSGNPLKFDQRSVQSAHYNVSRVHITCLIHGSRLRET